MTFNADVFPFFTLHPTLLLLMSFPLTVSLSLSYGEDLNSIWHNLFHLNLISLICSGELESERKAKTKRGQGPEREREIKYARVRKVFHSTTMNRLSSVKILDDNEQFATKSCKYSSWQTNRWVDERTYAVANVVCCSSSSLSRWMEVIKTLVLAYH